MGIAILGTALTIAGPLHFSGNILVFGYVLSTLVTTLLLKKLLKKT